MPAVAWEGMELVQVGSRDEVPAVALLPAGAGETARSLQVAWVKGGALMVAIRTVVQSNLTHVLVDVLPGGIVQVRR